MRNATEQWIARMNEFIRRMSEPDHEPSSKPIRPKDAATLILIDRSGSTPKVLLGKRHERHAFMPGKFVFPGGRVDASDKRMPVVADLDKDAVAHLLRRFHKGSALRARALALAAIRETCEETGLLLGTRAEAPNIPPGPWDAFARHNVLPDLSAIHFVGRAITPPGRPRRFDARFFTMDASAIAYRIEGVTGPDAELVELIWMPIKDAEKLDIPAVTSVMLEELETRIADGFGHDLPVPFYHTVRGNVQREVL